MLSHRPTTNARLDTARRCLYGLVALAALATLPETSSASPIRTDAGFTANTLAPNDDGSTGSVGIGFNANFLGTTYSNLYVNNNGNVTFTGPLGTFTPFSLVTTATPIIAPFFADVDTRAIPTNGSKAVTYGTSTVNGHAAFGVNWVDVGYYSSQTNKLNQFQLVMIDRSDTGAGNFDFEFNYGNILWETGGASGGTNGLGGSSARAGFSNGSTFNFELTGSAVNGAFINGGPNQLTTGTNVGNPGQFLFSARNGGVSVTAVPEPATLAVFGGIALTGALGYRRRKATAAV